MNKLSEFIRSHAILILILVGSLIYVNSLFNGFIGDDFDQIVNNSLVHSPLNIPQFFVGGTFFNGYSSQSGIYYKPLLSTVFSLIYPISFSGAFIFHLIQLALHITNTILLFKLFKKFFKETTAFVLSLLFLIHPANAESVLYISALQEVLFLFFGLVGLHLLIKKMPTPKNLVLMYGFFLLSLLSKETGILFLFISLLWVGLNKTKTRFKPYLIASSLITFIYLLLRLSSVGLYRTTQERFPFMELSLVDRLKNIPELLMSYINLTFFPKDLAFTQNWVIKEISFNQFYLPLLLSTGVLIILLLWGWNLRKEKSGQTFLLFFLWLVLGLSLHLQILPLDMTLAERWLYFPLIGALGLLGILMESIHLKGMGKNIAFIFLSIVVLFFGVRSFVRTFDWRDQFTLYSHDARVRADSYNLQNGLASEYLDRGDYPQAKIHIIESISLKSDYCYSWNNLGLIYLNEGNNQSAGQAFKKAIENGGCYLAYQNLATFLYFHSNPQEAKPAIQSYLKVLPNNSRLWFMLSLTEAKLGERDEALKAILISNKLSPSTGTAYVYNRLINNQPIELRE